VTGTRAHGVGWTAQVVPFHIPRAFPRSKVSITGNVIPVTVWTGLDFRELGSR
jgi:hypothetical protein